MGRGPTLLVLKLISILLLKSTTPHFVTMVHRGLVGIEQPDLHCAPAATGVSPREIRSKQEVVLMDKNSFIAHMRFVRG